MHATWKACLHKGNILISSPSENSIKHMAHSVDDSPFPEEELGESAAVKVDLGRDWRAFFLRPLFGGGDSPTAEELTPARRRIQAQRATAAKPDTHMRAQRRAESITTMSVSAASISSGGGGADSVPRNLEERVMLFELECLERKMKRESGEDKEEERISCCLERKKETDPISNNRDTHIHIILIYIYA